MKTTSAPIILNVVRRLRAGLALITLAMLGNSLHAHGQHDCRGNDHLDPETAEVEALLTAVHDVTSYNGDERTAIGHLADFYELWAEDATLTVNGGAPKVGRDAIVAFFSTNPLFTASYVGLTPSFRTKISIHGKTAEIYLECIFLTEGLTVGPQRSLSGTVRKVHGKWLFWKMANNPAQPLFQ